MLDFLKKIFAPEKSSSDTARDRLRLVLLSDHLALAPEVVDALRADILAVISKYVEIDSAHADLTFEHRENEVAMLASIPIIAVRDRGLGVVAPYSRSGPGSRSAVAAGGAPDGSESDMERTLSSSPPAPAMSLTAAPRSTVTPEPFGARYEDGGFGDEPDIAPAEPLRVLDGPGPVVAAPSAQTDDVPPVAAARPAPDERDGAGRPRDESDVAVAATHAASLSSGETRAVAADRFGLDAESLGLRSDVTGAGEVRDDDGDDPGVAGDNGVAPEASGGVPGALLAGGSSGAASARRRKRRRKS